jgi:hypothetical protein
MAMYQRLEHDLQEVWRKGTALANGHHYYLYPMLARSGQVHMLTSLPTLGPDPYRGTGRAETSLGGICT